MEVLGLGSPQEDATLQLKLEGQEGGLGEGTSKCKRLEAKKGLVSFRDRKEGRMAGI